MGSGLAIVSFSGNKKDELQLAHVIDDIDFRSDEPEDVSFEGRERRAHRDVCHGVT